MKTYSAKPSEVVPSWVVIDAAGRPLGRLAVEVARLLQGKHKPVYTRHILTGDYVVVVNASQVAATGRKLDQKAITRYTGYPGGLRKTPLREMLARHPDRAIRHAVKGMLPHESSLARQMLQRLKVYPGPDHPHAAQVKEAAQVGGQGEPSRAAAEAPDAREA